jgi:hypothetical protein
MARKKAEAIPSEVAPAPASDVAGNQQLMAAVVGSYNDERDLVNQLLGQAQAFSAAGDLLRTFGVSKLAYVKENKLYRGLAGTKIPNRSENLAGTWEEFCGLLGMSVDKADQDINNLRAFGEEALESMSRMGIGYRELRQYRRLPEDSQTALIEVAKTGDKEALLDLAEELIAKQKAEKDDLVKQVDEAKAVAEDRQQRITALTEKVEKTEQKLTKAQRQWRAATADDQRTELEQAVRTAVMDVRTAIAREPGEAGVGLRGCVLALAEHAAQHNQDVTTFLGNCFAELMVELQLVRDDDQLPIAIPVIELEG